MAKPSRRKSSKKAAHPARPPFSPWAKTATLAAVDIRNIVIVAALAITVRGLFFVLNRANNPVFDQPIMDGLYHQEWAERILAGNFWGEDVFFRAPLYPYFLALLFKISGSSVLFAILIQHLIGTVSAVLTYLVARRIFRPAISLVAGLIAATYWTLIYFEGDLLIVTLIVCLDLAALLFLLIALQSGRRSPLVIAGAVLGLSAIARPSILIFLPVLPVVFWLESRRQKRTGHRRWILQTTLAYAATIIVITPVLVRNYAVGRDIVPIASQGGVNFYIGNNPESDGATAVVPGTRWDWWGGYEDAIRIAETDVGRRLRPSEVSNYYFRKGLSFIFTSPDKSLPLLWRKLQYFWAGGERSNNKSIYFFWHLSGMGRIPLPGFWFVGPLGLLGGVLLWRKRPEIWLLQLFVVTYMIGVVAFFVNGRFRSPIIPVLIIFTSYAVFKLIHDVRARRRGMWREVVLIAVCVFAVDWDFRTFPENNIEILSVPHYTLGNAYLKMGDTDKAIREYEAAVLTHQRHPTPAFQIIGRNVIYNLGRLYWGRNQCEKAVPYLEQVGGNDRYTMLAKICLGDCYTRGRRYEDAVRAYRDVLAASPNEVAALRGLAKTYTRMGDRKAALDLLQRARSLDPANETIEDEIRSLQDTDPSRDK